jgi:hypothetical protein
MATEKISVNVKAAFGCLAIAVVLFSVGAAFVTPHFDADPRDLSITEKDRAEISSLFAVNFTTSNIKVQQFGGFNLEIRMPRREFEDVNFADRKSFMEKTGGDWCEEVETWASPTLTVRDIGDGRNLAIYHCRFGYADMNPK